MITSKHRLHSPILSSIYSGGCIKSFEFNQKTYLIYSDGINLSQLTIKNFDFFDCSLHSTPIYRFSVGEKESYESIFQIDIVSPRDDLVIIVVKLINCLVALKLFSEGDEMKLERINQFQSVHQFKCGRINRVDHEKIFGTINDKLNVYDVEANKIVWSKEITNHSTVIDDWNEIQSINHQSLCITTNRTSCTLHDMREPRLKPSLELFSLTHPMQPLRINSHVDSSFYHGTDLFDHEQNSLYLFTACRVRQIDIRCPYSTLFEEFMPLPRPVSYSSICISSSPSPSIHVVVESQCYATHMLWKMERTPDTISYSKSIPTKSHSKPHSLMSLGITMYLENQSRNVFTIDNRGDIFGIKYSWNDNYVKDESYLATLSDSMT